MKRITIIMLAALLAAATAAHAGWWRTFGGADSDGGECVQQTSDGGYIITGFTRSFGTPGESDIWLIKLDSLGHEEWSKTYGEGIGYSVRETQDGGYIIAGNVIIKTDETGEPIWTSVFSGTGHCVDITNDGNYVISGSQSLSLWLIELNQVGDSLWAKTYQKGNNGDVGRYVEQTSDGGYIIVGRWYEYDEVYEEDRLGLWLLKTDSLGSLIWEKTHGGEEWGDRDWGECVRQTDDGGFIIAGNVDHHVLIKTDEDGDTLWVRYEVGTGYCVEQTLDSGIITTGNKRFFNSLATKPVSDDLWLIKTNANGDTTWTRTYGGNDGDFGLYVQQTSDSGYIVTGYTWSFGAGREDLYLLKTDSLGLLGVEEQPNSELSRDWEVVRSVGSDIHIRYSNAPQGFRANIYNSLGQKVDVLHAAGSSGNVAWGSGYPSGVYFIRIANRNKENNTARVVLIH